MSTRIYKDVGAFIALDAASQVLVPDVSERVAEYCEEPESLLEDFMPFFEREMPTLKLCAAGKAVARHQAKKIASAEVGTAVPALVREIHFYDSPVGFLFRNLSNLKYSRANDDIDYLENCTCMQNTITPAVVPLHASGGQRYLGPPDPDLTRLLDGGVRMTLENQFSVFCELASRTSREFCPFTELRQCIADSGLFAPEVDPLLYLIARKLGLLKEGVTLKEFDRFARPSILTYWS